MKWTKTMENKWIISEKVNYDADSLNKELKFAFWEGHRDFAYDLLNYIKPKKIMELGSQYGCSLFAFCQAVKNNNLSTQINAVDYWKGDLDAPDTGEEIFELVKKTRDTYFSDLNINLYQMGFDDAIDLFDDETFDLIHIDGGHRYEDVEHDLSMWLPKLKPNGIILFHDIYSTYENGSCEHWIDTKKKYPFHFEFKHSLGLGILFPKGEYWYNKLKAEQIEKVLIPIYTYKAQYIYTKNRLEQLQELYKKRFDAINEQSRMIDERDRTILGYKALMQEKLETIESYDGLVKEKDEAIKSEAEMINERDKTISGYETLIKEKLETIEAYEKLVKAKDEAIKSEAEMIDERDRTISGYETLIKEKEAAIEQQQMIIDERDATIREMEIILRGN